MTAQDLQNAINQWANLGWTLDRMTSGETAGFLGGKDVFLLIFKKEVVIPRDLYILLNGQSVLLTQPVFINLKQNRQITPESQVCFKGMNNWQPLHQVSGELTEVLLN